MKKNIIDEYKKVCEYNLKYIEEKIIKYQSLRVFILKDIDILRAFILYIINNIDNLKNDNLYIYCTNLVFGKTIKKSGNMAGKYLNVFTALGLIEKKVDKINDNKCRNVPAKYFINEFTDELLKKSDEIARLFMINDIKIADFDKKNSIKILGEEKTNNIFFAKMK